LTDETSHYVHIKAGYKIIIGIQQKQWQWKVIPKWKKCDYHIIK